MATRREVVFGLGIALFNSGCRNLADRLPLPQREFQEVEFKVNNPEKLSADDLPFIDSDYLRTIFDSLTYQESTKSPDTEIVGSLRLLRKSNGWATAFQIDQSGYYLTARHALTDEAIVLFDPIVGTSELVSSYVKDEQDDIAVIFAPTKQQRNPSNLRLNTANPKPGEKLSMAGFSVDQSLKLWRGLVRGTVDTITLNNSSSLGNLIPVVGMKPFGGSSGGPVWNDKGEIVGIESSYYPLGVNSRSEYKGAAIAPLSRIKNLSSNVVYILEDGIKYTPRK